MGAWAADTEREEAEQRLAAVESKKDDGNFPSLTESVTAKQPKKKKGQTLSLAELQSGRPVGPGGRTKGFTENKGLTTEEMLVLPTGPRDRTGEEPEYGGGGLGGGFRDYGRNRDRAAFGSGRDEGRKGYGGFDDDRRQGQQSRGGGDRDMPSRADEADNWGSAKKSLPPMSSPGSSFERRRYDGDRFEGGSKGFDGGSRGFDGGSRADEADNWGSGKTFVPSAPPDRKSMGFGSSYNPASDSDRWGSRSSFKESNRDDDRLAERPRLVLNPPRAAALPALSPGVDSDAPKTTKPSPFGSARPREEVLAEKNPEWKKHENDIEERAERRHSSRPTSAHSSRPGSPDSQSEVAPRRTKLNPFGDAKPREEVLKGKGLDYRKMEFDLDHRRVERPETEDEVKLKEEINALKELAKQNNDGKVAENGNASGEENQQTLSETIMKKEKELELLITELDDKIRFDNKRGGDRPGSTGGRPFESFERPGSQSGRSDNGKNFESFERPKSRGSESGGADVWTRSGEERRGMYGSRERTFTNRERPDSRNRW